MLRGGGGIRGREVLSRSTTSRRAMPAPAIGSADSSGWRAAQSGGILYLPVLSLSHDFSLSLRYYLHCIVVRRLLLVSGMLPTIIVDQH